MDTPHGSTARPSPPPPAPAPSNPSIRDRATSAAQNLYAAVSQSVLRCIEVLRNADWNRVLRGLGRIAIGIYSILAGAMAIKTMIMSVKAIVISGGVAALIALPVGIGAGASAVSSLSFGASKVAESLNDIWLGLRNTDRAAWNPLRDTVFQGHEHVYYLMGIMGTAGSLHFAAYGDLVGGFQNIYKSEMELARAANWKYPDGSTWWPPHNGAVPGSQRKVVLQRGTVVARFGGTTEKSMFVTERNATPETLSLAPNSNTAIFEEFRVLKPIEGVEQSIAAPWFDQPGGGVQFTLPRTIFWLQDNEYLSKP